MKDPLLDSRTVWTGRLVVVRDRARLGLAEGDRADAVRAERGRVIGYRILSNGVAANRRQSLVDARRCCTGPRIRAVHDDSCHRTPGGTRRYFAAAVVLDRRVDRNKSSV